EAQASMAKAIEGAKNKAVRLTGSSDLCTSFDGSWMKRGRASLTGFVACIDAYTNKVLSVEARHKYCATCKGKGPCQLGHACSINHRGSAGSMEPVCTVAIVIRLYGLGAKITQFLGDGDTRAFNEVQKSINWPIIKLECVNHVAKRFGTRLRER